MPILSTAARVSIILVCVCSVSQALEPIARRVPPPGIELPAEVREKLTAELAEVRKRFETVVDHPLAADVEIYLKAVDYALQHSEFYSQKDFAKASMALASARSGIAELQKDKPSWQSARGLIVRGYYSSIDGSPQPYGLVVPDALDLSRPVPLYVWLHGRGDKKTDLHFIDERQRSAGRVAPANAIVLHPFGRQCIGYKSAGEIDVLESIEHVANEYNIDRRRIVLMGFSMGGAGAWHVGAHYADRWVAMSPGAGFAETARYNRLAPADYPPEYVQKLWGLYDVPGYTRNLFNLPVIAYSGEIDKQIQAARVMEEAFLQHGRKLTHLIGPGMGHQYHPDTLKEILRRIDKAVEAGLDDRPQKVSLQTQTMRYHRMHWVSIEGLGTHWSDARVDAELTDAHGIRATTLNVTRVAFSTRPEMAGAKIAIDGQTVEIPNKRNLSSEVGLQRQEGRWKLAENEGDSLAKRPGLQGPIDDVLMEPFLVVTPTGRSANAKVQAWVDFELAHFQDRWRALYRGELRQKRDEQVTADDIEKYHLILWGDPRSNRLMSRVFDGAGTHKLPLSWNADALEFAGKSYDAKSHVPLLIYPNPLNRGKYVVLNSGPTFREGHDRTNSLQNPKLGDWAIINLTEPPSDTAPGRVVKVGFFDEDWK